MIIANLLLFSLGLLNTKPSPVFAEVPETELLLHDVEEVRHLDASVKGVLGLNALTSFDFTLSPSSGRLDVSAERPTGEIVVLAGGGSYGNQGTHGPANSDSDPRFWQQPHRSVSPSGRDGQDPAGAHFD